MQALTVVANLMIVNLLTLICCIPIFTIGAALSGMHYILLKIARKEEGYIVKSYFHGFKENFVQATVEWLIYLVFFAILGFELYLIRQNPGVFPGWFGVVIAAALLIVFIFFQWVFPLQMRFINKIRTTMKNSVLMSLANFPRAILMALVWGIPAVLILVGSWRVFPIVFLFGLSFPGWLMAKIYSPVFKRFEPEEEPVAPDEDFSLEGFQETQQAIHDTASASANPDITAHEDTAEDNADGNDKA